MRLKGIASSMPQPGRLLSHTSSQPGFCLNLLPCPRVLELRDGYVTLPSRTVFHFPERPAELMAPARRLQEAARRCGIRLVLSPARAGGLATIARSNRSLPSLSASRGLTAPAHLQGYTLDISPGGVRIAYRAVEGLHSAVATLGQLLRECGRRLPCLHILDWPDFARRGVMLDVSRGRVPTLRTLLELVERLADFKLNEFQLYFEHTFAYSKYRPVWRGWGALTGKEIRVLDGRCRVLGIDLVPNQNSFGHLRPWLEYPPLKHLAEVSAPYASPEGDYLRRPSTLAPRHPGTLPFLRGLYDELLPNFSSRLFNVGCDETWDLGLGQSKAACRKHGKGRVYLGFLKAVHREVRARGRRMMFWGDIILNHPRLIPALPKSVIALNWGYEASHPFSREASLFAKSGIPFYVCPGTSSWMSLVGRHDNALMNLRSAARAGRRHGARGYLIADWGDGGHPQPLAVSYLPWLAGAALAWCGRTFAEEALVSVLSRDVFQDRTLRLARSALALGRAHRKLGYRTPNGTPLGTALTAPPLAALELFCRGGLGHYRRVPARRLDATIAELNRQRAEIARSRPGSPPGRMLARELDLAARMAVQSCKFMLWQQAVARGNEAAARRLANSGLKALRRLEKDFSACWRRRNKGGTERCAAFLRWRMEDYRRGVWA
jgi:hexosaminidase